MTDLRELATHIGELAVKAKRMDADPVVHLDGDPCHVRYIRREGGALERVDAVAPPINESVADIYSLVQAVQDDHEHGSGRTAIFCSLDSICAVLNVDAGVIMGGLIKMPLPRTQAFDFVRDRVDKHRLTADEFREAIRYDLYGCDLPDNLADQISTFTVATHAENQSIKDRSKESLGRAITAEAGDDGANLPDPVISVGFPVWIHPDLPYQATVQIHIDPDLRNERWYVRTIERSFNKQVLEALRFARRAVLERLAYAFDDADDEADPDHGIQVYCATE